MYVFFSFFPFLFYIAVPYNSDIRAQSYINTYLNQVYHDNHVWNILISNFTKEKNAQPAFWWNMCYSPCTTICYFGETILSSLLWFYNQKRWTI